MRLPDYKPRENSGTRSTNRLNLQASFALTKIVELFEYNFVVIMDIIDDVALYLHDNENKKDHYITYQLKTVDSKNDSYSLNKLISDDVFFKLYDHINQLNDLIDSIYLITNAPIKHSFKDPIEKKQKKLNVANINIPFTNMPDPIKELIETNMQKNENYSQFGLSSKFKYSLWDITVSTHYDITQAKLLGLCTKLFPHMDVKSITALHQTLYESLINKQAFEFELSDDFNEILPHKSYSSKDLKSLVYQAASVNSLTMETIKNEYILFNNLLTEIQYNKALVELKSKIFDFVELFENNFKLVESAISKEIHGVTSKKELFENLKLKLHSKLIFELSETEKDLYLIHVIEEVFKRGINNE